MMFFMGVGTAAPRHSYTQSECWASFQQAPQFPALAPRSRAILKKVLLGDNGIETRHLALDHLDEAFVLSPDILQARFAQQAPLLATRAAESALAQAGLSPVDIDAILISTCTGYLCPGLTSYVGEKLGLRPSVLMLDLVGQGCGAALPNLRTAEALLTAGRAERVLSICVEICSAALYLDDDPGVLVSACLFGDGAGAVVLSSRPPTSGRQIKWKGAASTFSAEARDQLRFEHKDGMLRNILSLSVPEIAASHAQAVLDRAQVDLNFQREQVTNWIFHAGGRNVLQALQKKMSLSADDVRFSSEILAEYGNVSSPFVYFVLERALRENIAPGLCWMATFGAGFSSHGALLEIS